MTTQTQTLRTFTALRLMREQWAGQLILGVGLKQTGQSLALATLAAGAAGLFVDDTRNNACTFNVTTLDEALRALKNEIRQGRAITVGLTGNWLGEIVERGVLPAIVAAETPYDLAQLIAWGASPIHGLGLAQLNDASTDLEALLYEATNDRWALHDDTAASLKERRVRDADLAHHYEDGDTIAKAMQQWLRVAPTLFPRDAVRTRWVSTG